MLQMECELCMEAFDPEKKKRPKVLPCGHTACLLCLECLPECSCPGCRRVSSEISENKFLKIRSIVA